MLDKGDADLSILFTTDAQLFVDPTTTRSSRTTRACCPPATYLHRRQEAVDEAGPDFQETIEKVQEGLTLEVMQELNARVDIDKEKPADVAAEYLQQAGYTE